MPTYGGDNSLRLQRALDSIHANTLKPTEILLVVDGPIPDNNEKVLKDFSKKTKIRIIRLKFNVGITKALNLGLKNVRTPLVVRADSDDTNDKYRFQKLITEMDKGLDLCGADIKEINNGGKFLGYRRTPKTMQDITLKSRFKNPFNHMTVCFRLSAVISLGGYPDIFGREDYGLWIKFIANNLKVKNIPHIAATVHVDKDHRKRRRGLKYAMGEFKLQKFMLENGVQTIHFAMLIFFLRTLVYMQPAFIQNFVYKYFLRTY